MDAISLNKLTTCRAALLLTLVWILTAVAAMGQEFRGATSGAVTDSSGAAIPGASVVVKEIHTGTTNMTKSDTAGPYVVPFLLPGQYQVTASGSGFRSEIRNNIKVEAQAHPIVNLHIAVGSTGETVEVNAAPPLVDQANASVGQVSPTAAVEDCRSMVVRQRRSPHSLKASLRPLRRNSCTRSTTTPAIPGRSAGRPTRLAQCCSTDRLT